jgi:hypothetical protein
MAQIPNYPSNSKKTTQAPIIQGPVKEVEKKATDKAADAFKTAGSYILKDVLLPAVKDTAVSMVTGAIQMLCYGETRNVPRTGTWQYGQSSSYYHGAYGAQQPVKRSLAASNHGLGDMELVEVDADVVLEKIAEHIQAYGRCPVAAVKQWVGISSDCMDENYGWTTMQGFSKTRYTAETVILHLPQPVSI